MDLALSRRAGSRPRGGGLETGMALLFPLLSAVLLLLSALTGLRRAMLALVLLRPSCDQLFNVVKEASAGGSGPGGAVNLVLIALGLVCVAAMPAVLLLPSVISWLLFLAACVASMLHGPDPAGGMRMFLTQATYAAAFVLPCALLRTRSQALFCLKAALASSIPPAIYALIGMIAIPGFLGAEDRLESTFTHPNIFAFYLVGEIVLVLFLLSSSLLAISARARRLLAAYAIFLLMLLLLTKTRSAWVAMAAIFAVYALLVNRRGLLLAGLLPAVLLVPGVGDRMLDLDAGNVAVGYEQLNSYAWRQLLWAETLQWMRDNPSVIFGNGLDLYQSYLPQFFSRGAYQEGVGPHNSFLQVYFEMGFLGLAAFSLIFASLFWEFAKFMRDDFAGGLLMMLLATGYLIVFYSDNVLDYLQFQWFFWFCTGAACALARVLRAERAAPREPAGHGFIATSWS